MTLTVEDQFDDPVIGLSLELRKVSDNSVVTTGVTNITGRVVVTLLVDGDYYLLGNKSTYSFIRQNITVADTGVAQAFTLEATLRSITAPAAPLYCKVYGFVDRSTLNSSPNPPFPGVHVEELSGSGVGNGGTGFSATNQRWLTMTLAVPSRGGIWEVDLRYGSKVKISIPALNYTKTFITPSRTTANIEDIFSWKDSEELVVST